MSSWLIIATILAQTAFAQRQAAPAPVTQRPDQTQPDQTQPETQVEEQELIKGLTEANNVPVDVIRVLEAFLKRHPESAKRPQVERALAKAAIDSHDDQRTVLYGERVLAVVPDDILVLDRVSSGLLAMGGAENAAKAVKYAQTIENLVSGLKTATGSDAAHRQEERDRALARSILYQARARAVLGEGAEAEHLAARGFAIYPGEESARIWSETLEHLGRKQDAMVHLADAFSIPDPHSSETDRAADRRHLGEMYREQSGSEKGLGDFILAAYDRMSAIVLIRQERIKSMDPNGGVTDASQFTLRGLDGNKLPMTSLAGKVVVLDFWATWCGPCRAQHPMYETLKQRFANRSDVAFLAIDMDEDHQLVAPFLDEQKWNRSAVYFEDGLARLLQVSEIPTTILLDKRGHLASRMNGYVPDAFIDQMTARINEVLQSN